MNTASVQQTKKRLLALQGVVETYGGTMWFWRSQIWAGRLHPVQVARKMWLDTLDIEVFLEENKIDPSKLGG